MTSDLVDQHVPAESAYAFLSEHARTAVDGELAGTCKTDGEVWPCLTARAFLAGRRSGLDIAASRLDSLAEGFVGTVGVQRVRQIATHLHVDADEIDQGLRSYADVLGAPVPVMMPLWWAEVGADGTLRVGRVGDLWSPTPGSLWWGNFHAGSEQEVRDRASTQFAARKSRG